jgi:hypothetical protein
LTDPREHWRLLEEAWAASSASPLSVRKAMLVVALIDSYVDRLFGDSGEEDVLEFRRQVASDCPTLGLVMDIAGHQVAAPTMVLSSRAVPLDRYDSLVLEDFMISVYNDHTVQELVVRGAGTPEQAALTMIERAFLEVGKLSGETFK